MLDIDIALRDLFYLLFGVIAATGTMYALMSSKIKHVGDEREILVRLDETTLSTKEDVADIKDELRQSKEMLNEHERRIIELELSDKTQWRRIDEIRKVG